MGTYPASTPRWSPPRATVGEVAHLIEKPYVNDARYEAICDDVIRSLAPAR